MMRFVIASLTLVAALAASAPLAGQQVPGAQGLAGQGRGGARGQGPVRDPRETASEGTAVIRGRILAADTGTPIRRAQVRATAGNNRGRLASTDSEGRFEFRDLPSGRWNITASKAGFVTLRYGQRRPFEAGRPLEVADGQVMNQIDFTLPRGAAITGRVFDEFGDPVAGARVQVLRYQIVQGSRRLMPTGAASQSDDTGAFRVYGLMPGDYYVSATLRAQQADDPDDVATYAPTYFPGTGSVTDAQAITLGLAQEQSGINFGLLPVRTVRLSGVALDSMGIPLSNGNVMLSLADQRVGVGPPGQALAQFGGGRIGGGGRFTIPNVAPGSYTLTVFSGRGGAGGRGGALLDMELASVPLEVGSDDITALSVITGKGATLGGALASAADATAKLQSGGVQVTLQPFARLVPIPSRPARVADDGTFVLTSLFGQGFVRVNGLPQGWTLKSVTIGGVDVTDTPLEFRPNQEIRGAQIVVTNRVIQLSGTAVGADGKPARDYTAVLFPDDESKWTAPSRFIWSARPDQEGKFEMRGLPANSRYLAVAVDYLEDGEANDPEFLASVRDRATPLAVADGDTKAIQLRFVER
jgi:hypothetical protein